MLSEEQMLQINKNGWNKVAPLFFEGSFDKLGYGIYTPTDKKLGLFGELQNQVILEVESGSGHKLPALESSCKCDLQAETRAANLPYDNWKQLE